VFRMFSRMSGQRVACHSDGAVPLDEIVRRGVREKPDVGAIATRDGSKVSVLVWHYHDDDLAGPDARLEIKINGLPTNGSGNLQYFRIDETHSNAFTAWKKIGSPQNPTAEQYAALERAGHLTTMAAPEIQRENGAAIFKLSLPRQGVSLLEWTL